MIHGHFMPLKQSRTSKDIDHSNLHDGDHDAWHHHNSESESEYEYEYELNKS